MKRNAYIWAGLLKINRIHTNIYDNKTGKLYFLSIPNQQIKRGSQGIQEQHQQLRSKDNRLVKIRSPQKVQEKTLKSSQEIVELACTERCIHTFCNLKK